MKKWFIVLLLGSVAVGAVQASELQAIFDSANRLYQQNDFSGALQHYQRLEGRISSWKLYFNMGNCYYKLNDFVKAKIYYLRARRLKPLVSSIERNIRIVNARFKDQIPERKIDFINRIWLKIESWIPMNMVSLLLVMFIVMLNGALFLWMKQGKRKPVIYGFALFLLLSLLTGIYHHYRVKKFDTRQTAVVIRAVSNLRSGPGENNTVLFSVSPGLTVNILEKSGEWLQVSASTDIAGWIKNENVVII